MYRAGLFYSFAARVGATKTVHTNFKEKLGGLGDAVASAIIGHGVEKFLKIGINDVFGQSGKPADLLKEYELTGPQIAEKILKNL